MARISSAGLDDLFTDLRALGDRAPEVTERMVEAGAEVVAEHWRQSAESAGLRDTGDMIASIRPANPKKGNNATSREVYPQGTGRNGTRNAEKAFINHYGTSRIKPTYFVDAAEQSAESPMTDAMRAVWDSFISK